jgi:hypothetical protein
MDISTILNVWHQIPYKETAAIAVLNNVMVGLIKPVVKWKMPESEKRTWFLKLLCFLSGAGLYSLLVWLSRIEYEIIAAMLTPAISLVLYELKFVQRLLNALSNWLDSKGFKVNKDAEISNRD